MYQQTDKFQTKLKRQIRNEFNYLGVLSFDELNAARIKELTEAQYKRFLDFNEREYRKIARQAYQFALSYLDMDGKDVLERAGFLPDEYVYFYLNQYNFVTGYLYEPEADRKRLRQSEEMATAVTFLDYKKYQKALDRCANLWFTQSYQYALGLEDGLCLEVWKKAGVKKVIWVSEEDERTCKVCAALDGNIYDIDNVPPKQHINCRCIVIPYKTEKS